MERQTYLKTPLKVFENISETFLENILDRFMGMESGRAWKPKGPVRDPVECQTFLKTPLKNIFANISNILNDDDEHDIDVKMEREMFINTQTGSHSARVTAKSCTAWYLEKEHEMF